MKNNLLIFISLFVIIFIFTNGFLNTFFQQDEWNGFGLIISLSHQPIWAWFNMLTSQHLIPLTALSWLLLYKIFGFQAQYYVLIALILHTFAAFLVYQLTKNLSKNNMVGLLAALFFITNARASTAFIHLAVFLNTISCLILILLFFLYLEKIIKKKIYEKKDAFILLTIFISAVLFREDALVLIPLLLVYVFIYDKKALIRKNISFFVIFYFVTFAFFIFRFTMQILNPIALDVSNKAYLNTYLYNAVTFPVKLVVQNLIDGYYVLLMFIYEHHQFLYPIEITPDIINWVLLDFMFLIVFMIIIVIGYIFTRKINELSFWKNIYFFVFWILIDAALLASIGRRMNIIEERYLYISSVGVFFIFSLFLVEIYKSKSSMPTIDIVKKIGVLVVIFGLLIISYLRLQAYIKKAQAIGSASRQVLSDIKKLHPTIPRDTIFFVRCSKTCYRNGEFGLPNDIVLPFSSGPGWIIMLYYAQNNENAYAPFFTRYNGWEYILNTDINKYDKVKNKEFLWDYGAEGYRKIGDYSFGYFINMDLLRTTLKKENLNKNMIIGLEYNEKNFKIKDISNEIRDSL